LGRVLRDAGHKPAEPDALVHVIHPDREAAAVMARSWERLGFRTELHPNARAFAQSETSGEPGCLIVHVPLAERDQVDLASDYPVLELALPMIMTADKTDVRTAVLAMKAGAIDFFEMPLSHHELGEAVETAIRIDRARRQVETLRCAVAARYATLTRREREVMNLVTQGRLNKEIAGELELSEITVKVHRGAAMRKMEARTLAALVRMADMVAVGVESSGKII
jgi:FixJ family two-component response regulator